MSRKHLPATTLLARVRHSFGLEQKEIATYLGVSPVLIKHIEAGRRALTSDVLMALLPMARLLPDAPPPAPPLAEAPPELAAPEVAELDFRRRTCQQQALRINEELARIEQQVRVARHWAQALPSLLAAAAMPTPNADAVELAVWRADWLQRQAQPLPPAVATRWHLLRARAAALAAEIAAL